MAAASDGTREIGGDTHAGEVFISEDGGDTWSKKSPEADVNWDDIVISGNGNVIMALDEGSSAIEISSDGGDTWASVQVDDLQNIKSISIADDGDTILVGGENSNDPDTKLYRTDNRGLAWEDISPNADDLPYFSKHDISADGNTIAIATNGWTGDGTDGVFTSTNGGQDWTQINPSEDFTYWGDIALSDDASTLALRDENSTMYLSNDLGTNWHIEDPGLDYEDENNWEGIDFNEDGTKGVVAGSYNAYLINGPIEEPAGSTVTMDDAEGAKTITLTTPDGTTITCHSAVKESGLSVQDAAYSYPLGLVDFCFSGAGESNAVSILFVTDLKPNQVTVRKYNPTTNGYATIAEATVTETTYEGAHALLVTYNIADNGPLDTDLDVGEIADPVGLGVLGVSAPNTGLPRQK